MTNKQLRKDAEVKLEEGTPIAEFQKVRTDAITEMFDSKDEYGIYQTSRFFAKLDDCVRKLLSQATKEAVEGVWKPFDTAPKGREILVCFPNQGNTVILVRWNGIRNHWTEKGVPCLGIEKQGCLWTDIPLHPHSKDEK